jgi:hypothetical protein
MMTMNQTAPQELFVLKSLNLSYNVLDGCIKELNQLLDKRIRSGLSPLKFLELAGCFITKEIEGLTTFLIKCAQGSTSLVLNDCELSAVNLSKQSGGIDDHEEEEDDKKDKMCLEELHLENITLALDSLHLHRNALFDLLTGPLKKLSLSFSSSTPPESLSGLCEHLASILDQEDCLLEKLYVKIPQNSFQVHQRMIKSIAKYGKLQVLSLTVPWSGSQRQVLSNDEAEVPIDRHLLTSGGLSSCRSLVMSYLQLTSMTDLWCSLAASRLPKMEKLSISVNNNIEEIHEKKESYFQKCIERFFSVAAPELKEFYLELIELPIGFEFEKVLEKGWQSRNKKLARQITR